MTVNRTGVVAAIVAGAGASLLLLAAGGCDDNGPVRPIVGHRPEACFEFSIHEQSGDCRMYQPEVDPVCTTDEESARRNMTIRWDFDGDGRWETGWVPLTPRGEFDHPPLSTGVWRIRCEVRDEDGNVSAAERRIDMREHFPTPPDIIAGDLRVRLDADPPWSDVDTVEAGQPFGLWPAETDWLDTDGWLFLRTEFRLNHEFWFDQRRRGPPLLNWNGCPSLGFNPPAIETPGIYRIEVILDAGNAVNEFNERNNRAIKSLVVVPPR